MCNGADQNNRGARPEKIARQLGTFWAVLHQVLPEAILNASGANQGAFLLACVAGGIVWVRD